MRPGTWPWLLKNEMRLSWRGVSRGHLAVYAGIGGLLWAFMHWGAWVALPGARGFIEGMRTIPFFAGGIFWLFTSLALSQTIMHSVNAFITRGDLDLLLSSPLRQRDIFLVRALGIALSAALLPGFALLPLAHVGPLRGYPGFLGIYPVVASTALACAACGIIIMITLVRLLGARRARTAGQIFGAVAGVLFFLAFHLPSALPAAARAAFAQWLRNSLLDGGLFGPSSPLWWPVRAIYGEPLPLLAVLAAGTGLFWLAVTTAYGRFVAGTQESVSGDSAAAAAEHAGMPVFSSGLTRVLLLKEWRMILRDMQVISQTLLQLLYLLPIIFIGFKSGTKNAYILPAAVAASAMLAGGLAWLTVNAEDAPELISSSPVPAKRILWIKAAAAVIPALALLLPLAAWWVSHGSLDSVKLLFFGGGAMLSAALIQVWSPSPGKRGDMKNRMKTGGPAGFIELLSTLSWTGLAFLIGYEPQWAFVPAVLIGVALLAAWHAGRFAREKTWGLARQAA